MGPLKEEESEGSGRRKQVAALQRPALSGRRLRHPGEIKKGIAYEPRVGYVGLTWTNGKR
jgi:hypothetical protein